MIKLQLQRRIEEAKRRAHGQWPRILAELGVDAHVLSRRNQPCPGCGGEDRFQFTDKFGDGNYICRGCGPGDGFALLALTRGWKFIDALAAVERLVGRALEDKEKQHAEPAVSRVRRLAQSLWDEAKPVVAGDAVAEYLGRRGITLAQYPTALRTHPALGFYAREAGIAKARRVRAYPAMLALVQRGESEFVTLHRTYLEQGAKAPVADPKKLLNGGVRGAAVRLFEPTGELAIAEGIETALAVHVRTGVAVWAALSAANMEHVAIPAGVARVAIYADHDASYVGQAAAYALAKRLKSEENRSGMREVTVYVPRHADTDWADVLLERTRQAA